MQRESSAGHSALRPSKKHETWADRFVGAFLWIIGALWALPMMSLMVLFNRLLPPASRSDWLTRLYCRGQVLLTGCRWRAVVDASIEPNRSYMFVQNHTNHFDHAVLYCATPHFKQGLELEKHFRYPVYGWMMKARGTIPVRPYARRQLDELRQRIAAEVALGHSILVFPEGTRTLDGRVGKFRKGAFLIARDLGLPIVPVAITGSFAMMRKGSWVIHPGHTVTVHCLAPVETGGLSDEQLALLMQKVHAIIAAQVDAHLVSKR